MTSILITSGGTKVPIDPVRDITNQSQGNFASKLAIEALEQCKKGMFDNYYVRFLYAKGSKSPFSVTSNIREGRFSEEVEKLVEKEKLYQKHRMHYSELEYTTFDDYKRILKNDVDVRDTWSVGYDIILLAAAVSDYLPKKYSKKKVKSSNEMTIELKKAEKLISKIKTWSSTSFLVGFKMLVDAKDQELIDAARLSIAKNKCDLVIANDYVKIKAGKPEVILVHKNGETEHYDKDGLMSGGIPQTVMQIILSEAKK